MARPLSQLYAEGWRADGHRSTSDGASPSRTTTSDDRRKKSLDLTTTPRLKPQQGACLATEVGTSGRNQRHGESRSGSSLTTSSLPAYSPSSSSGPGVRGRHVPASAISSSAIFSA